jgi:hypothetical protein
LQSNDAHVSAYNQVQTSQTNAYKDLKNKLALANGDLLKMIKTEVLKNYDGNNLALAITSPEPVTAPK